MRAVSRMESEVISIEIMMILHLLLMGHTIKTSYHTPIYKPYHNLQYHRGGGSFFSLVRQTVAKLLANCSFAYVRQLENGSVDTTL